MIKNTVFIVQSVINSRKTKTLTEYLVQFAGFSLEEACWEPTKNLPKFIIKFYECKNNLGKPIPPPKIKQTKHIENGTEIFIDLEWTLDDNGKDVFDYENLFDLNADKLCAEAMKSSCNTMGFHADIDTKILTFDIINPV